MKKGLRRPTLSAISFIVSRRKDDLMKKGLRLFLWSRDFHGHNSRRKDDLMKKGLRQNSSSLIERTVIKICLQNGRQCKRQCKRVKPSPLLKRNFQNMFLGKLVKIRPQIL